MSHTNIENLFNSDWREIQFMRKGELIAGSFRSPDLGRFDAAIFRGDGVVQAVIFVNEKILPNFEAGALARLEELGWSLTKIIDSPRWAIQNCAGEGGTYFDLAVLLDKALDALNINVSIMGDTGIDVTNRDIPDWYTPGQEYEYELVPVENDEDFVWHKDSSTGDGCYRGNLGAASAPEFS